jgi:hypothetical protein
MNRADVRMIQCGRGASLALKPAQRLGVQSQVVSHELERDEAIEPGVFRFVDHTHASAAKLLHDAIVGDRLAEEWFLASFKTLGIVAGNRSRGHLNRRRRQKRAGLSLRLEQGADLALQRHIAGAAPLQRRFALVRRKVQGRLQQALDDLPAVRVHLLSGSVPGTATPWRHASRV